MNNRGRFRGMHGRSLAVALGLGCFTCLGCGDPPGGGAVPSATIDGGARAGVTNFWACLEEANAASRRADHDAAIKGYEHALELRPDHEDSLYYLGNSFAARGRLEEAIRCYERLVAVNPLGSSRGYMRLGRTRATLREGRVLDAGGARSAFEKALEVDPDSGANISLAELSVLEAAPGDPRPRLVEAHRSSPQHPAPAFLLGYVAWRAGDTVQARRWLDEARERVRPKAARLNWSEEGDAHDAPRRRWIALAEHSLAGNWWLPLATRWIADTKADLITTDQAFGPLHEALRGSRPPAQR